MTDAPERIWASHPGVGWDAIGGAWHHIRDAHDPPQVLYRRADLPPTLAEAMTVPEVRAFISIAEEYRLDNRRWADFDAALASLKGHTP